MTRNHQSDYTGIDLEWTDDAFEVGIPGEHGALLSAGTYTLRLPLRGLTDGFEPGDTFTLEHNEVPGRLVTFRYSTSHDPRRQTNDFGRWASAEIDRQFPRIEEWAVNEAARRGLDEAPEDERQAIAGFCPSAMIRPGEDAESIGDLCRLMHAAE